MVALSAALGIAWGLAAATGQLLRLETVEWIEAAEVRASDAVQAIAKLRELGTATADQLYNVACVYNLVAAGIKAEKILAELGERMRDGVGIAPRHVFPRLFNVPRSLMIEIRGEVRRRLQSPDHRAAAFA